MPIPPLLPLGLLGILFGYLLMYVVTRPCRGGEPSVVAARVNGEPIRLVEVESELKQTLGKDQTTPAARSALLAHALAVLVDRRLALLYLEHHELAASRADIDSAIERHRKQLAQRQQTLDDFYRENNTTEFEYRRLLAWRISWSRYLDRHLTDENLKKYFEEHAREFDGTQLHCAHVFLPFEGEASVAADRLVARLESLRSEIEAKRLSFAAAAEKHSKSPTKSAGGDIGWIERKSPMSEAFTAAAFRLEPGQTSPPVVSPQGVHLIHCLEVRAGKRPWTEVRQELIAAVTQYLFRRAADQQRPSARIEFTGSSPYLDPKTGEVIGPPGVRP